MTHNLLKGKRGIIFGALNEDSIAWKVAVKAVEGGASTKPRQTEKGLRMGPHPSLLHISRRRRRLKCVFPGAAVASKKKK